jgi:hypothetical protein
LDYTITQNQANEVTTDSTGKHGTTPAAGYWTYIAAPATLNLDSTTATSSGGVYTLALSNQNVSFSWGDFFENKSPLNFYNDKFSAAAEQTVTNSEKIKAELDAMHTALDNKKITLTCTLEAA